MACGGPTPPTALALRRNLGRPDLKLALQHPMPKFASSLDSRPIEPARQERGILLARRPILVSGPIDGHAVDPSRPQKGARRGRPRARRSSPIPACASTMFAKFLRSPTAAVIGTHFKIDGDTWNVVDQRAG